jgi:hypothetical protein
LQTGGNQPEAIAHVVTAITVRSAKPVNWNVSAHAEMDAGRREAQKTTPPQQSEKAL